MLDERSVKKYDPGGMRDVIASLPEQLAAGIQSGTAARVPTNDIQRIFIVGMGGSAIGGEVFRSWVADRSKVAIQVVRDYRLPAHARPEDLVVAVSYSGNTEETLGATTQGIKLGCRIVAITSGGTLRELGRANGFPVLAVPAGLPPRGAFGYMFGVLAGIGGAWTVGEIRGDVALAIEHLRRLRTDLRPESPLRSNRAKALALRLRAAVPVIFGAPPFTSIAKRWQTQLNENAKVLAFVSSFPEADHNELVGWVEDPRARNYRPILLRDQDEAPDLQRQLDITVSLMSKRVKVDQVRDDGETLLSRMLGTLYLGDYVSLYLAALRRVDPLVLKPIQTLKKRLAASHRRKS